MMLPLDQEWHATGRRLLSDINVTPFIDVMLVLLIVFMVVAPLMMVSVPLKLPRMAAEAMAPSKQPVVISLDRAGRLFVGRAEVREDRLAAVLGPLIKADAQAIVLVRADHSLSYGQVVDLLGKIGAAGVARVSLVAESQPLSGVPASTPKPAPPIPSPR